ncbi:MAG: hypothetical protein HY293_17835 [Planctomycetes bacterium]|nr:hypothetical protein [Planctomycetota bacterium]
MSIVIDDLGVRRDLGGGKIEEVAWKDLAEVQIITPDRGPCVEDVFYVLVGENGTGCLVSQEDLQCDALLSRLQALPGFDNGKVIEAMGSAENARFICWKKS